MNGRCKDCKLDGKIKKMVVLRFIASVQSERREGPEKAGPVCLLKTTLNRDDCD